MSGLAGQIVGCSVRDAHGAAVGRVEGRAGADWLAVRIGRFGELKLVPLAGAQVRDGEVWLPYEKRTLRHAPRLESAGRFTRDPIGAARAYFGVEAALTPVPAAPVRGGERRMRRFTVEIQ